MDVDEIDEPVPRPSHPLDNLHLEIIEHFTPLLHRLVDREGGEDVPRDPSKAGLFQSMYAPDWARTYLEKWTAKECIEYLESRKKALKTSVARLPQFLTRPYTKGAQCRTGKEWTHEEWVYALRALERIGESW